MANDAIDEAFKVIEEIQQCMTFHQPHSELTQLNRCGHLKPVQVSRQLWTVLTFAQRLSTETEGVFDVTVAPALVQRGLLPLPETGIEPSGTWQDVQLGAQRMVFFRRPLWIDLGGIGKGYAVDCCAEVLQRSGVRSAVINAGGDLRVIGQREESIALRLDDSGVKSGTVPVVTISNGSVASSCTTHSRNAHILARRRTPLCSGLFASVIADTCITADALTKVVLTDPASSVRILRNWGAQAYFHSAGEGWSEWK